MDVQFVCGKIDLQNLPKKSITLTEFNDAKTVVMRKVSDKK